MRVQRPEDQSTTTAAGTATEGAPSNGDALKRGLKGLPYAEQVAALQPGGAEGGDGPLHGLGIDKERVSATLTEMLASVAGMKPESSL